MLLTSLHIVGFRSIQDLRMEDLGRAVILYGQNGAGKSNILAAIRVLIRAVGALVSQGSPSDESTARDIPEALRAIDFALQGDRSLSITARFLCRPDEVLPLKIAPLRGLDVGISALLDPWDTPKVWLSKLTGLQGATLRDVDLRSLLYVPTHPERSDFSVLFGQLGRKLNDAEIGVSRNQLRSYFVQDFGQHAIRGIADLRGRDRVNSPQPASTNILEMLSAGDIRRAFVTAHQHDRLDVRNRFTKLQRLLTESPLSLPSFDAVRMPDGQPEIQVRVGDRGAVPLDLAGLGAHQLLYILASIVLESTQIITLEEPEAHLHAPTSGRNLRFLLVSLLDQGLVEQLFIATHSNLFDLDPDGFWHVERGGEGTQATYENLAKIDELHVYEPGPAKHALMDVLRVNPEAIVASRPDGAPITGAEMIRMLQEDTVEAKEFCQNVTRAAVRLVRTQNATKG